MAALAEQPLVNSFNKVFLGAAGTSGEGPPEDEFNRVSFLSHFEGANNGVNNAFDDGSTSNHTISANGNVTQGSFAPFVRIYTLGKIVSLLVCRAFSTLLLTKRPLVPSIRNNMAHGSASDSCGVLEVQPPISCPTT